MAEPATATQELTFASEDARVAALEGLQNRAAELTADDLAEIERIENAKIVAEGQPTAQPSQPPQPAPAAQPQQAQPQQAASQPVAAEDQPRSWQITEDMIAQFDEQYEERKRDGTTRVRPTITQRTPEDLLKTLVHGQRRIRYLEGQALPDAHNDGYKKARSELTPQIEKLQRELEEARAKLATVPQQAPATAPQAQQPSVAEAARKTLADTLKGLDGVADDDLVDHVPKLAGGLKSAVSVIEEQSQQLQALSKTIEELKAGKIQPQQPAVAQQPSQQQVQIQQPTQNNDAIKRWQEGCRLVDSFVGSPACPPELKMDQRFDDATADAMAFHNELGVHYTGKPASELTNTDIAAAVAAYLAESPQLVQRVNVAGAQEPYNYRKWLALDQIDALRTGSYRDPRTKVWKQRYSPDNGNPVQFPDMQSAHAEYLRITGKDKAVVAAAVRDNTRQLVDAMTRRDNGLVQMDTSKTLQGDAAVEATVKQAEEFLNTHDFDDVRRLARRGNRALWDQYNVSLKVLGQEPLPDSAM